MPDPSLFLLSAFGLLLAVTLAFCLAAASRLGGIRAWKILLGVGLWMGFSGTLAAAGVLERWSARPPPFLLLVLSGGLAALAFSRTEAAGRIAGNAPVALLVGFQAFRFPLELTMHRAFEEGLMPVQMSYSGWNFDILTGLFALAVGAGAALGRPPSRTVALAFNVAGLVLLANIVGIAAASTPMFAAFGPEHLNVWIATAPFVWLPCVFVPLAFVGHLLLARRLGEMR